MFKHSATTRCRTQPTSPQNLRHRRLQRRRRWLHGSAALWHCFRNQRSLRTRTRPSFQARCWQASSLYMDNHARMHKGNARAQIVCDIHGLARVNWSSEPLAADQKRSQIAMDSLEKQQMLSTFLLPPRMQMTNEIRPVKPTQLLEQHPLCIMTGPPNIMINLDGQVSFSPCALEDTTISARTQLPLQLQSFEINLLAAGNSLHCLAAG